MTSAASWQFVSARYTGPTYSDRRRIIAHRATCATRARGVWFAACPSISRRKSTNDPSFIYIADTEWSTGAWWPTVTTPHRAATRHRMNFKVTSSSYEDDESTRRAPCTVWSSLAADDSAAFAIVRWRRRDVLTGVPCTKLSTLSILVVYVPRRR